MAGPKPSEDLRESSIRSKNRSIFSSKSCPPKTLIASSSLLRTGFISLPLLDDCCASSEAGACVSSEAMCCASSEAGDIASSEAERCASSEATGA